MDYFANFVNSNCYLCNKPGLVICNYCFSKLEKLPLRAIDSYSLYSYNPIASRILLRSKYAPFNYYLLRFLVKNSMVEAVYPKDSLLCPIPISSLKRFERKFNQATIITRDLSKKLNLPWTEIIYRKRDSNPLFALNRDLRKEELKDIFGLNFGYQLLIKDFPNIVLIDDLITTGETLSQAKSVLLKAGFSRVFSLTLFQA